MKEIMNFKPTTILNTNKPKLRDTRLIRTENIDKLVNIIITHQLNFKEITTMQPRNNEFGLTSPSTYMALFLKYIYMYENQILEVRNDQITYTYNEMYTKAKERYKNCKLAEKILLNNEWRCSNLTYVKAVKCYVGTYYPTKQDVSEFKNLYKQYNDNEYCSLHAEMLSAVINKFDIDKIKIQLKNLQALKEINESLGFANDLLNYEIQKLSAQVSSI